MTQSFVLEQDSPLSRSRLWAWQRRYYEASGAAAFSGNTVPHAVTSNPFIARAYARVVQGWLEDFAAHPGAPDSAAAPPLHIVELGSGSGRFACLFLDELLERLRTSAPASRVRYVVTDFSPRTLESLRAHPRLAAHARAGVLDFAHFDALHDTELRLAISGETLAPGSPATPAPPLVVIANYFFDSLPNDAFAVRAGRLVEQRVTLRSPQPEPDADDPTLLERVIVTLAPHAIDPERHYEDPRWSRILAGYPQAFDETSFLFPTAALDCVRRLSALAGGRLLLLTGDKGYLRDEELRGRDAEEISQHGSISVPVNYHAIARYVGDLGGETLAPSHRHSNLLVAAFLLGPPADTRRTRAAYHDAIDALGPDDFFSLRKALRRSLASLDLDELLAFLRYSAWDATLVLDGYTTFKAHLPTASPAQRRELRAGLRRVWERYFFIGEQRDLPFVLGMLCAEMTFFADALEYLHASLSLHGPDARTYYQIAHCQACRGDLDAAVASARRSLSLQAHADAEDLLERLKPLLESTPERDPSESHPG